MSNEPKVGSVVFGLNVSKSANIPIPQNIVLADNRRRNALIAEARGIMEGRDAVDPLGGAHFVSGEYNRLREILDELEKLP